MTIRTTAAIGAMLAGLAVATHAQAQDADQQRPRGAQGPRATTFLSPAGEPFHAPPGQPYPVSAWFAQADANHDGKLTREEFRADFERFFKVLDENHDGVVDGFEVEDYEHKIAPEILSVLERPEPEARSSALGEGGGGRRRGRRGGGDGGDGQQEGAQGARSAAQTMRLQMQGAAAYSLLSIAEPVAGADANVDGKVSLAEFRAAADRRFDLLDAKHLGYLTLETLPRTPDQILAQGKKPKSGTPGAGPHEGPPPGGAPRPSP